MLLVKNVSASRKRTHNIVKNAELGRTFKNLMTKSDNHLMKLSKEKTNKWYIESFCRTYNQTISNRM